jgi:hypothetical protein
VIWLDACLANWKDSGFHKKCGGWDSKIEGDAKDASDMDGDLLSLQRDCSRRPLQRPPHIVGSD